jgi:hypothetical protein
MKLKLFLLTGILFVGTAIQAQQKDLKLDDIVNEQFGTLLESLLVNGKIDETNAKTYLETVFGYDESVNSYIQGLNLTQQIQNAGKRNLSIDKYVESLGSNLFNLIPTNYQQQLLKNPNYIGWKLGQEMNTGKISTETMGNAINLLVDSYKQSQQNRLIIEKLKQITPQINGLKSTTTKKLTVINDSNKVDNWKLNPVKIKKGFFSDQSTYNKVTIESGSLVLEPSDFYDKFLNIYKNKEKFDFSKDFKIIIKGKLGPDSKYKKFEYQGSGLSVLIGQYYLFETSILYSKSYENYNDWSAFSVKTPEPDFTTNYGTFYYPNVYLYSKEENVRTVTTSNDVLSKVFNGLYKKSGASENKDLNFNNGFVLVIQSEKGDLSYFINGIDTGIKNKITYMPNKFSFDIKGEAIIESVKLEHL